MRNGARCRRAYQQARTEHFRLNRSSTVAGPSNFEFLFESTASFDEPTSRSLAPASTSCNESASDRHDRSGRSAASIESNFVLGSAQVVGRGLAGPTIRHDVEGDLLSFVETAHPRAFNSADMNKDVFSALIRLNEAEALLAIEPFNGAVRHVALPFRCVPSSAARSF